MLLHKGDNDPLAFRIRVLQGLLCERRGPPIDYRKNWSDETGGILAMEGFLDNYAL